MAKLRQLIDGVAYAKEGKDCMKRNSIRSIVTGAFIAAIYVVITLVFGFTSFGPVQVRFSEAFTILPAVTPVAVPAIFVGCLISNIFGGNGLWDIVVGSIATLLSAYLTYKLTYNKPTRKLLAPLPPVIVNAVIVGPMLSVLYNLPFFITIASVGIGQIVACYFLGYPLLLLIGKNKRLSELFARNF